MNAAMPESAMLSLWRHWRRGRLVAPPFPDEWKEILSRSFDIYPLLLDAERDKLHDDTRILAAEKNWEGCRGL